MPITLYGIKNCDTVKKARRWFEARGIDYRFHDLRADGVEIKTIEGWLKQCGAGPLVNRRSTTWRGLSATEQARADGSEIAALLVEQPTLIKRPVIEATDMLCVGFDPDCFEKLSP